MYVPGRSRLVQTSRYLRVQRSTNLKNDCDKLFNRKSSLRLRYAKFTSTDRTQCV